MFGQRHQSVTLQGEDQVRQYMPREHRRKGPRRVPGFPVRHQRTSTSHCDPQEVPTRVGIRYESALGDRKNGGVTYLQLAGLFERMGNHHALPGVRERLGKSLEQGGVTTSEEDHDLSLGRCANAVKGRDRLRVDFEDLGS